VTPADPEQVLETPFLIGTVDEMVEILRTRRAAPVVAHLIGG
jgi:hypothetical protein